MMNWKLVSNKYELRLRFKNQTNLAQFVLEMAKMADKMDHHPDLDVRKCAELTIYVYSHDSETLTPRDEKLKEAINELFDGFNLISD